MDIVGVSQQYGQMVKIECQICVWWSIVFQGVEQEVEFFVLFFFVDIQNIKYCLLYIIIMDMY